MDATFHRHAPLEESTVPADSHQCKPHSALRQVHEILEEMLRSNLDLAVPSHDASQEERENPNKTTPR